MQTVTNPAGSLAVLQGKKPAGGWLLYVGVILVLNAVVSATGVSSRGVDLGTAAISFLLGAPILALCARWMFQSIEALPDRLVWKRFPSSTTIPYADIRDVRLVQHVARMETFDEVEITTTDGKLHSITRLQDGNDLLRVLNTYGVRRG